MASLVVPQHRLALINGRAREEHQIGCDSACTIPLGLKRVNLLLVCSEEKVVGRVGHELSLTHSAGGGRNSSAGSVQTLDESGFEQEVTARGPLFVPY